MRIAGNLVFALGMLIVAMNCYLSVVRYVLHRLTGIPKDYRYVSGCPLLGSLLIVASFVLWTWPSWIVAVGIGLLVLDPLGIHVPFATTWPVIREVDRIVTARRALTVRIVQQFVQS